MVKRSDLIRKDERCSCVCGVCAEGGLTCILVRFMVNLLREVVGRLFRISLTRS